MRIRIKYLVYVLIVAMVGAGFVVVFSIFDPTPPRSITMSTGPEGSAYASFGAQYRDYFEKKGIELKLRSSAGAEENLEKLQETDGDVEVSFITMGSANAERSPDVASLGAMFFEPMWIFFSDSDLAQGNFRNAQGKRISIGPVGSQSNISARYLFDLLGFDISKIELLALAPQIAADQLEAGVIDAMIMVTSGSTQLVKDLLANEKVGLVNFNRASAFEALFPALTGLTVPAGVGDLARDIPPEDTHILAFTAIIAVRDDLHPAIQTLFLDAASEIHAVPDMFHAAGEFPSQRVFSIPLSLSASRYYSSGLPFLQRFLPFWLAVLVRQILVAALPLIGILYPALRVLPSVFDWAMRRRIFKLYGELRLLENNTKLIGSDEERAALAGSLDNLDTKVRRLRMPITFAHLVYTLRTHINVVRTRLLQSNSDKNRMVD